MLNMGKTKSLNRPRYRLEFRQGGRAVEAKTGYELVSFGLEILAQDTVVDGAIMDAPSVAEKIVTIFDSQKIKIQRRGHGGFGPFGHREAGEHADRCPKKSCSTESVEASQHIPFDIADVNLSYQLLEATENQMDVLLVAVKKDTILNHTNVLAQAGKTPMVVDIDAFALQNSFELNYEPDPSRWWRC